MRVHLRRYKRFWPAGKATAPPATESGTVDRAVGDVDLGARGGMIVGDAW